MGFASDKGRLTCVYFLRLFYDFEARAVLRVFKRSCVWRAGGESHVWSEGLSFQGFSIGHVVERSLQSRLQERATVCSATGAARLTQCTESRYGNTRAAPRAARSPTPATPPIVPSPFR
ncbi:unnamed protein product [Pieris brassicae]|uniref:Uncharacterized protein n=1 Tax=Pieris brassicae TaxID=7116 RepID=A0A9P0WZB6_PIEBR|nr:unnamed protein product [Pieris brassicae]